MDYTPPPEGHVTVYCSHCGQYHFFPSTVTMRDLDFWCRTCCLWTRVMAREAVVPRLVRG